MTKTSARKRQAAKKNFKKVFEDNDKENAKSRPSVYSVYLHKKDMHVVYYRCRLPAASDDDVVSISDWIE